MRAYFQELIVGAETDREAWNILKDKYKGSEKCKGIKIQTLTRDSENLKMGDRNKVGDFSQWLRM